MATEFHTPTAPVAAGATPTTSEPAVTTSQHPSHAAVPDWTSQADLHCPLCDYNLRGLTEPRCPECGYTFRWVELTDPALKLHPYLFEHHPRRTVWSFWKTAVGGLRPARGWTKLHPGQSSRPGRLLAYWVAAAVIALLGGVVAPVLVGTIVTNDSLAVTTQRPFFFQPNGVPVYQDSNGLLTTTAPAKPGYFDGRGFDENWEESGQAYAIWWGVAVAWPWATLLALMIFQISMHRAKVHGLHVRRCVLYSFDACLWAGLYVMALAAAAMAIWMAGGSASELHHGLAALCLPLLWVVVVYRLGCAYRDYLKFDHPWATVISTQIIVALAALCIFVNVALM